MARKEKTVYVLGAGFSSPANLPLQGDLLEAVISSSEEGAHKNRLLKFIKRIYGLNRKQAKHLALEDIYTPLHQAISSGQYLKSYPPNELRKVEMSLNLLISKVIDDRSGDAGYVNDFAGKLLAQKRHAPSTDKFSIISLNWDILLDKILFERLKNDKDESGKERGALDYCCHATGIDNNNQLCPGILAREQGKYSIKLIKIHGSLNWVSCPQCTRLFINKTEKEGIKAFSQTAKCPKCEGSVKLEAEIALPTFQKDLKRFHFQHIWNQAAIEISEATKIVFIGYSFPLADFDFRSLITKHVSEDATIDVVLYDKLLTSSSYDKRFSHLICQQNPDVTDNEEGRRYHNFFGDKIGTIHYSGVEDYVENHLTKHPSPTNI